MIAIHDKFFAEPSRAEPNPAFPLGHSPHSGSVTRLFPAVSSPKWNKVREVFVGIAVFLLSGAAIASTYTVTNLNDAGPGSLRQAIIDANTNPGADQVVFASSASSGTISLTSGELLVQSELNIVGPGPGALTIDANQLSRVINVSGTVGNYGWPVTISGLTLTRGGITGTYNYGGCVNNYTAQLTLQNVRVVSCSAEFGGGVGVTGNSGARTAVLDSTIEDNQATRGGGGVFNFYAKLTIARSVLRNNTTGGFGGGVAIADSSGDYNLTMTDSVVSGNTAESGGGVALTDFDGEGATFSFSRVLIANNTATSFAGGVLLDHLEDQSVVIENTTIAGNTAPNGAAFGISYPYFYPPETPFALSILFRNATVSANTSTGVGSTAGLFMPAPYLGSTRFANAVVSGNIGGYDLGATSATVTGNNSFFSTLSAATTLTGTANQVATAAILGALADNGGPLVGATGYQARLASMLPSAGSPLVNQGDHNLVPAGGTDQRGAGFPRIVGAAVDIGAVEVQPQAATAATPTPVPTLSEWGLLFLSGLLGIMGWNATRRRSSFH